MEEKGLFVVAVVAIIVIVVYELSLQLAVLDDLNPTYISCNNFITKETAFPALVAKYILF